MKRYSLTVTSPMVSLGFRQGFHAMTEW